MKAINAPEIFFSFFNELRCSAPVLQENDNEDSGQLMCTNAPLLSKYIMSFQYLVHNGYKKQQVVDWQVDLIRIQGLNHIGT